LKGLRTDEWGNHQGTPMSTLRHPENSVNRECVILLQLPPALGQGFEGKRAAPGAAVRIHRR
jgi:hypothetical protein